MESKIKYAQTPNSNESTLNSKAFSFRFWINALPKAKHRCSLQLRKRKPPTRYNNQRKTTKSSIILVLEYRYTGTGRSNRRVTTRSPSSRCQVVRWGERIYSYSLKKIFFILHATIFIFFRFFFTTSDESYSKRWPISFVETDWNDIFPIFIYIDNSFSTL